MELHPLHINLYVKWDFKFSSKNDFRVCKQVLSFLVVKMIWISHNFFSLLAKFWVIFPLFCKKILRLGTLLFRLLKSLWCFSFGGFFWQFPLWLFIQPLVNDTRGTLSWILTFRSDLSIFSWELHQKIASHWSHSKSYAQSFESHFLKCRNGAQLRKFRIMPVLVDFWYQWQLILLSLFTFMFTYRKVRSPLPFGVPRLNGKFLWREFSYSRYSRGLPLTVDTMSSTIISIPVCPLLYIFPHNRTKFKQCPAWSYSLCQLHFGILHETSFCMICTRSFSLGK